MALRFIEGFDVYGANGNAQSLLMNRGWTVAQAMTTATTTTPYGAGYSAQNNLNSGSNLNYIIFDNQPTWNVGIAFYPGGTVGGTVNLIQVFDGTAGTSQIEVVVSWTGSVANSLSVSLTRNGTVLAGPISSLAVNVWYHIELNVTINSTTGIASVILTPIANPIGQQSLQFTGNTQATTNAFADRIYFNFCAQGGGSGGQAWHDDIYVADGTGTYNNAGLGQARIDTMMPTGDGTTLNFTPSTGSTHYNLLSETGPDGDSTYVKDQTANDVDLYTVIPNLTLSNTNTVGLQMSAYCRKDDVNAHQIATQLVTSGTSYTGTSSAVAPTAYLYNNMIYGQNPHTGAFFTPTDIANAQFGVKLVL